MIPIITYHAIDPFPSAIFTTISAFEAQLHALAEAGYHSISLTTITDTLSKGGKLPENAVALTFDDGYESVYREAWPRLKEYGFSATIFLVTGYCNRNNQWSSQAASVPVRPLMTWAQVEEIAAAGWSLGAHTQTHPALSQLRPKEAEQEMVSSQSEIVERVGQAATVFAYPYGAVTPQVKEMARRNFRAAVSTQLGLVKPSSDPFFLERIDAFYLTPYWIKRMDRELFHHYLWARQWMRTLRRCWHSDWKTH
jgi:peptidoglycan/xylan/chitin deacetylase (PgdA/CDA1 family)